MVYMALSCEHAESFTSGATEGRGPSVKETEAADEQDSSPPNGDQEASQIEEEQAESEHALVILYVLRPQSALLRRSRNSVGMIRRRTNKL